MKSFKEFIIEAKLVRKKATEVEVGDIIQGNVRSASELDVIWGEVQSVENKGKDILIKVKNVYFDGGRKKAVGTSETINAIPHQVFAVVVK